MFGFLLTASKPVLIQMAYMAIRMLVTSGIFDRIETMVTGLIQKDISGDEKKRIVVEFAKNELNYSKTYLVDAIIAAVLIKERKGE